MSTSIQIQCPECRQTLNVRPEYAGKRVACKHCQAVFTINLPTPTSSESSDRLVQQELLKAEIANLQAELRDVRSRLEAEQERSRNLDLDNDTIRQTEQSLRADLESQASTILDFQNQARTAAEEAAQVHEPLPQRSEDDWVRLVGEHEAEVANWVRSVNESNARADQLQVTLDQARGDHEAEAANWVRSVEEQKGRADELQTTVDQLRNEIETREANWVRLVKEHESHVEGLQTALEQAKQAHSETSADWVRLVERHDALAKQASEADERARASEAELAEWKERAGTIADERDDHAKHRQELSATIAELEQKLDHAQNETLQANAPPPAESGSPSLAETDSEKDLEIAKLRAELSANSAALAEVKQELETVKGLEQMAKSHLYQLGIRLPH